MDKPDYHPEHCNFCGQTKTYLLGIDRGTVKILRAIAEAIGAKGINIIHPRKELEGRSMTSNEVGNLSRARFHGLIAKVRSEAGPGNYCLTTKGSQFLRGRRIPRFAIISKVIGHQIGYFQPETYSCTSEDFKRENEYWTPVNYEILEGRVVHDTKAAELPI